MLVVTVAQEVVRRLARIFQQRRAPSERCTLDLPVEIILMIAKHLDECALLSLSLACRGRHGLWERSSLSLPLAEKERLLLLLEKDIPSLYYCHLCIKLHHWHGRWSRSIAPWYNERLLCKQSIENHLWLANSCHIPYYHARLVMNHHFYGSEHGLPLHVLDERAQSIHYIRAVAVTSQHARIFRDKLLVLSVMSIRGRQGDAEMLRRHIDNYGNSVCKHLAIGNIPMQLSEVAKSGTAPGQFLVCGPTFGSCTYCLTDYSIEISWQGERKGYNIELHVYRGLGDCRTPFNWHWPSILDHGEELRSVHSPDDRPGGS